MRVNKKPLVVIGVLMLALGGGAWLIASRLARPTAGPPPPVRLVVTFLPTPAPATPAPAATVTAQARQRAERRADQAATSVARASATAAAATSTPRAPRRAGSIVPTPAATATGAPPVAPGPATTPEPAATALPPVAAAGEKCGATAGNLVREEVRSAELYETIPVWVFEPPCFDAKKYRYPAVYLLQGSGDIEGQWTRIGFVAEAEKLMVSGELPPFLIVMPNNDIELGEGSRFLYTSEGPGSWEDFIINDVVPMVDAKHAGWSAPLGRAIGGISRGGYWSVEIAFRNPGVFTSVGGHSPAISSDFLIGAPDDFQMTMMAHSPDDLKGLRVWLDVGHEDTWTMRGPDELSQTLSQMGVRNQFTIGNGTHDDAYWASRIIDYLDFYAAPWHALSPIAAARP